MKCDNCGKTKAILLECSNCGKISCEECWGGTSNILGRFISKLLSILRCPNCNSNHYKVSRGVQIISKDLELKLPHENNEDLVEL